MKTKLLYVVTSTEKDTYLEQLCVSVLSAKKHVPDCHVTVLTDCLTERTFNGIRQSELGLVDDLIVIDIDESLPGQKRSRLLKTNARKYVKGDFLFIDCDTIVVRDLSAIDDMNFELAACWDTHSKLQDNPYRGICVADTKSIGLDISDEELYFNSGVILARDTPMVHEFYKKWHDNYLQGYEKGVKMDQPSFAKSNIEMGYVLSTLPEIWNCQLKHGIRFLKDAYILHYLCTNVKGDNGVQFFYLNQGNAFDGIKSDGVVPVKIQDIIEDPFHGIAPVSHCFAGKSVFLFQTDAYSAMETSYLRSHGKWKLGEVLGNLVKFYRRIIRFIHGSKKRK